MKNILIAFAALAALGAAEGALAQSSANRSDTELLISQIQTDKRAIVLQTLELSDAQVQAFTPIYDDYQREMKDLMGRGAEIINKFAANYGSMTDDAAEDILDDFFKVRADRNKIAERYAKKLEKVLPSTKVLQWVQIENKLNALLDVEAAATIPISR